MARPRTCCSGHKGWQRHLDLPATAPSRQWLKFLRLIDRSTRKHLGLRLIVDNDASHSQTEVQQWAGQAPTFRHALRADQHIVC